MEVSVLGSRILPTILIMAPAAAVLLAAQTSWSEPAAEECVTHPTAVTPRGEHWYYRVNHAKQHCWYLGKLEGHKSARNTLSGGTAAPAPQPANIADAQDQSADQSASPPPATAVAPLTAVQPTAAPATTTAQVPSAAAPVLAAPTAQAAAVPPPPAADPGAGFTTRWPDGMPKAEDIRETTPASTSNAGGQEAADAPAQQSSSSPGATAEQTAGATAADTALRYFSIAGMLAIPLMLAVGWGAKYARRRSQSLPTADLWREVANREVVNRQAAERQAADREAANREAANRQAVDREAAIRQRQSADAEDSSSFDRIGAMSRRTRLAGVCDLDRLAAELGSREPLADLWRGGAHTPAPTPTDPADDLKASLAELMRDLRRAGAFGPEEQTPAHHADAQEHAQEHAQQHGQEHGLEQHVPTQPGRDDDAQEPNQEHGQDHALEAPSLAGLEHDADAQDHLEDHDPEYDPDFRPVLEAAE
jgi:hypothetical protein